ncbi:MAG: winged helix-turn-helix domain-containing protein [Alphaproteobacteria bacterium]|nr:winged helix-turn-helix domain-containing protein [Alphaproteobacteria bacterium]
MAYEKSAAPHTVLDALADPTRRAIFERLGQGPATVGALAAGAPVSRPAVSQHLKVLKEAGLVRDTAQGARRVYAIDPAGIGPLRAWLDRVWDDALAAFADEVAAAASSPAAPNRPQGPRETSDD